jgi:Annexin
LLLNSALEEIPDCFGELCANISKPAHIFDAECLHKSLDTEVIIETLANKTNVEIKTIAVAFNSLYMQDLKREVSRNVTGKLASLLVGLVNANRDETGNYMDVDADIELLEHAAASNDGCLS